jgi:hypothetical protein
MELPEDGLEALREVKKKRPERLVSRPSQMD